MRYPVHLRQFVFFFKRIVLHQKLVAAGFDVAEVLVQVDALVFHVEQAACDVRAVVSHTFQICQQVGQHKACGQRTFAALEPGQLEVYDIVNVFRPMSESPEKIIKLKGELEGFARQTVTGFVNNSNLLNYASADDLRQGYDILRETSDLTGIPIVHTTGRKKFLDEFLADGRDPKYIGTPLALETPKRLNMAYAFSMFSVLSLTVYAPIFRFWRTVREANTRRPSGTWAIPIDTSL